MMGLVFGLVALGLTIIFGVMDIVNFAHGEFLMIGMYAGLLTATGFKVDPLVRVAGRRRWSASCLVWSVTTGWYVFSSRASGGSAFRHVRPDAFLAKPGADDHGR